MASDPNETVAIEVLHGHLKVAKSTLRNFACAAALPGAKAEKNWRFHKDPPVERPKKHPKPSASRHGVRPI